MGNSASCGLTECFAASKERQQTPGFLLESRFVDDKLLIGFPNSDFATATRQDRYGAALNMRVESQEQVLKKAFENRVEQVVGAREREATDKVEAELHAIRAEGAKDQADKVRKMC